MNFQAEEEKAMVEIFVGVVSMISSVPVICSRLIAPEKLTNPVP